MKKVFVRLLYGFFLGAVFGNLLALVMDEDGSFLTPVFLAHMHSFTAAVVVHTLLCAFIGAVSMAGMSLYDETDLPLLAATVGHFAMILIVNIPIAFYLGWIEPVWDQVAIMGGIMLLVFVLIWLYMLLYHKRMVSELNRLLPKKQ